MIFKMIVAYVAVLLPALWVIHRLTVPLTIVDPAIVAREHDEMTRHVEAWRMTRAAGRYRA